MRMQINLEELVSITSKMSVLYAEDDAILRENTVSVLSDLFAFVDEANDGVGALEKYKINIDAYDIIITDLNMPRMNGLELIKNIQSINPLQAIIIISAHNEAEYFLESIRNSVQGYILKPIDFEKLVETLYKSAISVRDRKENVQYKEHLQDLVDEKTEELEQNYQKMHEFLTVDKVTKLQNATMLYHYLDHYSKNHELTAMLYNIDDFSFVNQAYGMEIGDAILEKVGQFLKYNISDEVKLFKYNSDEFVIIFDPKIIHPEFVVTQIQAFFRETPVGEYENVPIYITLSCGIATCKDSSLLLPHARTALKEAYLSGLPSQFNVYDDKDLFLKKTQTETIWIQKFRVSLEEDRIIPYFQPIIDNATEKIVKYECLARVEDDGEIISPSYFLEAARRSGLMCNLTRSMINKCFKVFSGNSISFSINITNEDLLSSSFIDFLAIKQKQYGIEPSQVIFEILEDIILNDFNLIPLHNLQILKQQGYQLALDDFGSDRSNFNRFEQLGIDFLKIDGQFIRHIDKNLRNQNIVEMITKMAHKMNIKVIAEFVATFEEFYILKELGVDFSQGYFFNKPLGTLV